MSEYFTVSLMKFSWLDHSRQRFARLFNDAKNYWKKLSSLHTPFNIQFHVKASLKAFLLRIFWEDKRWGGGENPFTEKIASLSWNYRTRTVNCIFWSLILSHDDIFHTTLNFLSFSSSFFLLKVFFLLVGSFLCVRAYEIKYY